jgi:hypothetical protein
MKKINLYNRTIIFSSFLTSFGSETNIVGQGQLEEHEMIYRWPGSTGKHEIRYCWSNATGVT